MSETRFNLRRPNPDPAADVESYIDHGTAALPAEEEPAAQETPEKIRRLVVLLPNSTHRRFKLLAAARETTMSDLCRTWIEEAIGDQFQ
ncbi:MAG: hypothetical protein OXI80_15275 [Caldilineaceae bacterium]|nr:hypothetical protein [Caldilineaceae bacterium]MDE0339031.1 hypothetical protein [Caldilineaceae bacterium]